MDITVIRYSDDKLTRTVYGFHVFVESLVLDPRKPKKITPVRARLDQVMVSTRSTVNSRTWWEYMKGTWHRGSVPRDRCPDVPEDVVNDVIEVLESYTVETH